MRQSSLLSALFALTLTACPSASEVTPSDTQAIAEPAVGQAEARKLALQKYQHLFHNAYRRDLKTGEFGAYPSLEEASFQYVESRGDAWLVRAEPLAGWIVRARVAKNGDWVDLHTVEFANQ